MSDEAPAEKAVEPSTGNDGKPASAKAADSPASAQMPATVNKSKARAALARLRERSRRLRERSRQKAVEFHDGLQHRTTALRYVLGWLWHNNVYVFGSLIAPAALLAALVLDRRYFTTARNILWTDITLGGFVQLTVASAAFAYFAYRARSGQFNSALVIDLRCTRHAIGRGADEDFDKSNFDLLLIEIGLEGKGSFALRLHEVQIRLCRVEARGLATDSRDTYIRARKVGAGRGIRKFDWSQSAAGRPHPASTDKPSNQDRIIREYTVNAEGALTSELSNQNVVLAPGDKTSLTWSATVPRNAAILVDMTMLCAKHPISDLGFYPQFRASRVSVPREKVIIRQAAGEPSQLPPVQNANQRD